jgi:hypothetical protein
MRIKSIIFILCLQIYGLINDPNLNVIQDYYTSTEYLTVLVDCVPQINDIVLNQVSMKSDFRIEK